MPVEPVARSIRKPELLVLTVLSAALHWWRLFTPQAVVFDELHYKHFAGHYLDGTHYYDVHPPLAKLLYAAVAKVSGVSAEAMLGPDPVVALRILPAFLGTLFVPLIYIVLRRLGAQRNVATLGAVAILLENALLVDSRFALIEPLMIPFGLTAVALYLEARNRDGAARLLFLVASAFAAGLSFSAKWTGASALAIVGAAWLFDAWRARRALGRVFAECAVLAVVPILVYLGSFAIHFALIKRIGPDLAVMPARYQATLIGSPRYDPAARMSFLDKVNELHGAMSRGNRSLETVTHPAASPWYTWPIMKHPIAMWQDTHPPREWQANIILLGNPIVWWGSLAVAGLGVIALFRRRQLGSGEWFAIALLAGGFVINFAPFIPIRRVMYLYHYLFALVFLVMLAAYVGGLMTGWQADSDDRLFSFSSQRSAARYWGVVAVIAVGFLYFLPFTYGWPLSEAAFEQRFRALHPF